MKELALDASDDEIIAAVREWAQLLAIEDYDAAVAFLYEPGPPSLAWTPEQVRELITHYGSTDPFPDGATFKVTPLEQARGGPSPRHEVTWSERAVTDRPEQRDYVAYVWFDLPLNGEWSDLTANLDVIRSANKLVLALNDLHVM